MAGDGEEDNDYYESDPEEAKMSLKMRRREASDDEEAVDDVTHHSRDDVIASDGDSDGQGGAAEYGDEEEEEVGDEECYEDGREEEEEEEEEVDGFEEVNGGEEVRGVEKEVDEAGEGEGMAEGEGEGEKKENEPFAVPISGAFYMHDDRFRDNAGARQRKTFSGRKLWESKDDRKWGHDKFEEMNMQERHNEEGRRSSRGYYHGRGKGRGAGRGNVMRNRMRGYDGSSNQNLARKDVRGRGPRRYQPSMNSENETLLPQNRRSVKSNVKTLHAGFGRNAASLTSHNAEHEASHAVKVASNLSYASPPFYPSGSSTLAQNKDVPDENHNRNPRFTVEEHNFSVPLSNPMLSGKNVKGSMGMDKLRIDDSVSLASAKPVNNVHFPFSESSLSAAQMSQTRGQGRGVGLPGSEMLQPLQSHNQINKVSPPASQAPQQNAVQNRAQASFHPPGHRSIGTSQGSPPKGGKGTVQGAGMGSLMYSGAQVMGSDGNIGAGNGDQNLPFFPVMQLGAQHPGGIGVPAVGMAFPGYVAQPNGGGNSEMTWLPVIASAAGALGATYSPPYLPIDGTYHSRPTGQTSALPASSKYINHSRPNNEVKPQQRSDVSNDEFSQRQNKPRRYSEMNITQ